MNKHLINKGGERVVEVVIEMVVEMVVDMVVDSLEFVATGLAL